MYTDHNFRWALPFAMFLIASNLQAELEVFPKSIDLRYQTGEQRLVVLQRSGNDVREVTGEASFRAQKSNIVSVSSTGVVSTMGNGNTEILIRLDKQTISIPVTVTDVSRHAPVSFNLHVQPILAARGCSTGACHGKARGQNGFQLSLLGFDYQFDFDALTREARGRRVFPASPIESLVLRKGSGQVPHGGGVRLPSDSEDYATLLRWINNGTPRMIENEPTLVSVEVFPQQRSMKPSEQQQLVVMAEYSDGNRHDVTGQSAFQSNENTIVEVNEQGRITAGPIPGESTIMVRFMGTFATCRVLIPLLGEVAPEYYSELQRNNFVDPLVYNKLQLLGITLSDTSADPTYVRRVFIDLIGRLPSPTETVEFLANQNESKRGDLVDWLLVQPEYVDHWANKWVDLLRPNPYRVGIKAVLNYDNWIRQAFRENRPYDEFVRGLVAAEGSTYRNGAATLFRDRRSPDEIAPLISQLFLGIRLECAKCHHHPFERWSQEDFYSFAAYFSHVGRKGTGLSPPISGSEEVVLGTKSGSVTHPRTNEVLSPRPLFGENNLSEEDMLDDYTLRHKLVDWMVTKDNEFFAGVMVNRIWADLMGRGLFEPVDDLRATNPASNEPLLKSLGKYFSDNDYDIKKLIAVIAKSHVYELSSAATERHIADTQNYSRHYRQRLRAEVLLDAVADITQIPNKFSAMPTGSRSNQIWTHRVSSLFLDTFGRPDPNQDPPCERTTESTVTQALHMMNAPQIHANIISDDGRLAALAARKELTSDEIVAQIYLLAYSRRPTDEELGICQDIFSQEGTTRRQAAETILWALMNTPEFIIKD
jgi:hypothetical protein